MSPVVRNFVKQFGDDRCEADRVIVGWVSWVLERFRENGAKGVLPGSGGVAEKEN